MFELLIAAGAGSIFGSWATAWIVRRSMSGGALLRMFKDELDNAFRMGFLTAADCVTLRGHEELAGELRRTAAQVRASNDNH